MQGRKMKPKTKTVCLHSIQAQVLNPLWNNQKILLFFLHSNFRDREITSGFITLYLIYIFHKRHKIVI